MTDRMQPGLMATSDEFQRGSDDFVEMAMGSLARTIESMELKEVRSTGAAQQSARDRLQYMEMLAAKMVGTWTGNPDFRDRLKEARGNRTSLDLGAGEAYAKGVQAAMVVVTDRIYDCLVQATAASDQAWLNGNSAAQLKAQNEVELCRLAFAYATGTAVSGGTYMNLLYQAERRHEQRTGATAKHEQEPT